MKEKFQSIKEQYPDVVLLFRCGDIYESYYEDALTLQDVLKITASEREGIKVNGFPFHALDYYLPRLVCAGKRVAICDDIKTEEKKLPKETDMSSGVVAYSIESIMQDIHTMLEENKTILIKFQMQDKYVAAKFHNLCRGTINTTWLCKDVVAVKVSIGNQYSREFLEMLGGYLVDYISKTIKIVIDK